MSRHVRAERDLDICVSLSSPVLFACTFCGLSATIPSFLVASYPLPTQGASIVLIYGASDALLIRPRVFLLGLIGASTAKLFRLPSPQLH